MAESIVYLVGAGPGDPGLLTLRAQELLAQADVVVYDYLASDAVMRFAAPDAERIFVGKKGFSNHVTQDQINDCLIELAKRPAGKIVRLKGGDPFVFGRGGEEALALVEQNIPFEVVPGVTAGVAAPAYAGIPVTHRRVSSSVALITGHETPDKDAPTIDWDHLACGVDTLCFYMGIRDLPMICERLIAGGRDAATPVALVRWGTTRRQETLVATLDTVVQRVQETGFSAPAIIVVGDVVGLREELSWFEDKPLFGKTIAVTRSREQASALSAKLSALGADVMEFPTIEIVPREADDEACAALQSLAEGVYDWCVFTSANGVGCFFDWLDDAQLDARAFGRAKVAAIGPATAQALAARGIRADLVPPRFVAESVAQALVEAGAGQGTRVLLPRAAAARDALPNLLDEAGCVVDVLCVYDTEVPNQPDQVERMACALREGEIDAITFTSSSTARNFRTLLADQFGAEEWDAALAGVNCDSIGPITSETMRACGIPVTVEAETFTIDGLVSALQAALVDESDK